MNFFADTSALAALLVPDDENHNRAKSWINTDHARQMISTDYIIDELYTVVLARSRSKSWTVDAVKHFLDSGWIADLIFITPEDFFQAEQIFLAFRDKSWSFTDCTSKIVMERYGIDKAFAFDKNFYQFGSVFVEPV